MPFIESSESLRSRLHLQSVSIPVLAGIVALALVAILLAAQNVAAIFNKGSFSLSESGAKTEGSSVSSISDEDRASENSRQVFIFVSGCVNAPGVYSLQEGARVADAVAAAGGFSEGAATDGVNLARVVKDGEQIAIAAASMPGGSSVPDAGPSAGTSDSSASGLVNINTATADQLASLPGIGPSTARKIVANRTEEGSFASKEDLKRVSGIGDKKYAALADLITV